MPRTGNRIFTYLSALLVTVACGHCKSLFANTPVNTPVNVIFGVPEQLATATRQALKTEFKNIEYRLIPTENLPGTVTSDQAILALGFDACRAAITTLSSQPILCALLSESAFNSIEQTSKIDRRASALVVDQPLERQVRVANQLFPSLKKFALLTSDSIEVPMQQETSVTVAPFNPQKSITRQVTSAIRRHDALIAMPDPNVYTSSTLPTLLQTTYGYATPVIGYSRRLVEAGALMTNWSSPTQLLMQAAEIIETDSLRSSQRIIQPKYFSIVINKGISRSLNLAPQQRINSTSTFVDGDFQ